MSDWERQQNFKKTENAKRCLLAGGKKDFNNIKQIKNILIFVPFILLSRKDLLKNTLSDEAFF